MKRLVLLAFLLVSSLASAAVIGPYPVGPGVPPLASAVARISRVSIEFFPAFSCSVFVDQFVSPEAYAANAPVGPYSAHMGQVGVEEFKAYVLDPIAAGTIKTYEEGLENWIIATKLPGWTKL